MVNQDKDQAPASRLIFPCQKAEAILLAGRKLGLVLGIIQMEMEFTGALNHQRLARALELLLDMHPILDCRLVSSRLRQRWEKTPRKMEGVFLRARDQKEYEKFRTLNLDPYSGPLIKLCLLKGPGGCSLLLKVSHEISDAGGVKETAMDLASIYTRLEKDPDFRPAPNIKGSRGGWQALKYLPLYKYPGHMLEFFRGVWSSFVPRSSVALPLPMGGDNEMTFIIRHVPPESVSRLAEYGRKKKSTLNDMMVAAFYRALAKLGGWDKKAHLRLQTTVDMRRYLPTGRAGEICNLSAMAYPYLGLELGDDFDETLERVSRITRALKENWIGMPMLLAVLPALSMMPQGLLVKMLGSAMTHGM